jgi:hypothetical protein
MWTPSMEIKSSLEVSHRAAVTSLHFINAVQPQKWAKPEGLSRKMAIHSVMLLDNNPLLPWSHVLCLAACRT